MSQIDWDFVVYIDTGSPVPNIPSKSHGLVDQNKKTFTGMEMIRNNRIVIKSRGNLPIPAGYTFFDYQLPWYTEVLLDFPEQIFYKKLYSFSYWKSPPLNFALLYINEKNWHFSV